MKRATTPSQLFVKDCFIELSAEARGDPQMFGADVRPSFSQEHIKKPVVATDNGTKKITKKFKEMDQARLGLHFKRR